tara:strand:- start:1015 stop:1803 length:789 start_codon:yes stop_codon:yes gene_type:complete
MKKLLFVSVLFFVLKGYSQDTIVNFLNNKRNIVLKDNASLIQVIIKKDTAVLENLYWAKTRKLKSFGHYLDNKLTTKIGKFEYYDKDGALEIIESYNKKGFRQGKYLSFKNKKKRTIGVYNNGKRNGMWNFYDDNGLKQARIVFKKDEVYKYILWDKDGNKKDEPLIIERKPKFPGGQKAYIRRIRNKLGTIFKNSNLQGKFFVKFDINIVGSIDNVIVFPKIPDVYQKVVENIFYNSPKCIPAISLNRNIKITYTMPITLN